MSHAPTRCRAFTSSSQATGFQREFSKREESQVMRGIVCFAIASLSAASTFAQGQQYGSVGGRVSSQENVSLPGVTVTVTSEAMQGVRTAVTDVNGVYSLP